MDGEQGHLGTAQANGLQNRVGRSIGLQAGLQIFLPMNCKSLIGVPTEDKKAA